MNDRADEDRQRDRGRERAEFDHSIQRMFQSDTCFVVLKNRISLRINNKQFK